MPTPKHTPGPQADLIARLRDRAVLHFQTGNKPDAHLLTDAIDALELKGTRRSSGVNAMYQAENRRLRAQVAAAPALVEALQKVVSELDRGFILPRDGAWNYATAQAFDAARAALRSAGEDVG